MSLAKQNSEFVKRLAQQPVFVKPTPTSPTSPTSPIPLSSKAEDTNKNLPPLSVAIQASIITILEYLKKNASKEKNVWDILDDTQIDLRTSEGLETYLQNHPKIAFNSQNHSYTYRPELVIKNKEELYEWIAARKKYPIDVHHVLDAYPNAHEALLELETEQKVYLLRHKSGIPNLIFYNRWHDPQDYEMNPLFKQEFFKLRVPDDIDLAKQLSQAGIKVGETSDPHQASKRKERKAKEKKRRIKITNLHLAGTDIDVGKILNIDLVPTPPPQPAASSASGSTSSQAPRLTKFKK